MLTKWGLRYTTTMYIKINFYKVNDFRSSLRYWPWGILVGVSGNYQTKAVALLLGESRAYGIDQVPPRYPGFTTKGINSMLKCMLINKNSLTLFLIGWRLYLLAIRSQVWKSWLTNTSFHLLLAKMAAISQTIFSGAFLWMKNFVFWFCSSGSNWQWPKYWFR